MVSFVSLVSLVQISQQNCSQTANFAAFVSISLVSLVSVAQNSKINRFRVRLTCPIFCLTCLTCSKNSQNPVLCLSHLSQSLSQFVSMEAVIPENSQICQFFLCLFQLYQSQQRVSCRKTAKLARFAFVSLVSLVSLVSGGLSGSGKKNIGLSGRTSTRLGRLVPTPTPQKKMLGPPPVGADQYQADPLYPLGKPVLKNRESPPDPLGRPVLSKKKRKPPRPVGQTSTHPNFHHPLGEPVL